MAKNTKQSKALPIYVLNGPNLNLLGQREPEVYGYTTLAQIAQMCASQAKGHGLSVVFHQSNHEGEIVDQIQEARTNGAAVITRTIDDTRYVVEVTAAVTETAVGVTIAVRNVVPIDQDHDQREIGIQE